MKTFDKVTKALSICGRHVDCKGCPYENVPYPTEIGNTCKDIMHYDALYYMQDRIDECQEAANPPLTWDELKQMKGKPVWVEADDGKYTGWFIAGNFFSYFEKEDFDAHVNLYTFGRAMEFSKETYGGYWQAYRKERSC